MISWLNLHLNQAEMTHPQLYHAISTSLPSMPNVLYIDYEVHAMHSLSLTDDRGPAATHGVVQSMMHVSGSRWWRGYCPADASLAWCASEEGGCLWVQSRLLSTPWWPCHEFWAETTAQHSYWAASRRQNIWSHANHSWGRKHASAGTSYCLWHKAYSQFHAEEKHNNQYAVTTNMQHGRRSQVNSLGDLCYCVANT